MSNIILEGTVGSTAYGLARDGSDVDTLGVFVAPTLEVAGLDWHSSKESVVTHEPDVTHHEVGKFLRLAMKANPTITELLWLPEYTQSNWMGDLLVMARRDLLSWRSVRSAYVGYATEQVRRLQTRTDGTFSSDTRNRTVKHARHILRLLRQGRELLSTGELTVRVDNPEEYFAIDNYTVDEMVAMYHRELELTEYATITSPLMDTPDKTRARGVLATIRRSCM